MLKFGRSLCNAEVKDKSGANRLIAEMVRSLRSDMSTPRSIWDQLRWRVFAFLHPAIQGLLVFEDTQHHMPAGGPAGAVCVQNVDGSLDSAIHPDSRTLLRPSSTWEPRDPSWHDMCNTL